VNLKVHAAARLTFMGKPQARWLRPAAGTPPAGGGLRLNHDVSVAAVTDRDRPACRAPQRKQST
jgi:hypothetical protein